MIAPKLRFKEFSYDWTKKTLGECTKIYSGYSPSTFKLSSSGIPFIKVNDLNFSNKYQNYVSEYAEKNEKLMPFKSGTIILPKRGAAILTNKIRIANFEMYSDTNIMGLEITEGDIEFFYYLLYKEGLYKIADTSTIPQINNKHIEPYVVYVPIKDEQIKIANFFSTLDKTIQLQQEKIELLKEQKKGYMQKIFSQKLRFKNKNGDDLPEWKTNIRADELFESVSNKNHNGDIPVLSATQDNGIVYRDTLERHMSFNDGNLKSYKFVKKDDFIISLRSFQGGIEFSTLQGLVSPAYTVFRKKNDSVYNLYFAKVFKTDNFITRLNSTTYGIRDGKAISYKDFSTLKFDLPSIEEQKKIAQFLDLQDKKISFEEKKLKELQNQKQAFLQQMFI